MNLLSYLVRGKRRVAHFRHHIGQVLRRLLPASRSRPPQLEQLFHYRRSVVDLGDAGGERLRGIFSPSYDPALVRRYIQEQFLENAATYALRYESFDFFKLMLGRALTSSGLTARQQDRLKILDIGSGSGNTIIPLLELCPHSSLLGTDLSADILVILKQALAHRGIGDRCFLLQLNAEELDFQPESFDLVVGGAILHHLIQPERAIAGCARILKKGGHAIFLEPFQEGNVELRDCYAEILADPRSHMLTDAVRNVFQAQVNDINIRLGTDKSDPIFTRLDDKWLFPKQYILDLARKYGFSSCKIDYWEYDHRFETKTAVLLKLTIQHAPEQVPDWVWQIVKKHDEAFPDEQQKKELLIEATIILRR